MCNKMTKTDLLNKMISTSGITGEDHADPERYLVLSDAHFFITSIDNELWELENKLTDKYKKDVPLSEILEELGRIQKRLE